MRKQKNASCAERIQEALKARGMKAAELCKIANIPQSSLSLYLSGAYEPKQDRVYAMASALNVDVSWLLGYDVPMSYQEEKMLVDLFRQLPTELQNNILEQLRLFTEYKSK